MDSPAPKGVAKLIPKRLRRRREPSPSNALGRQSNLSTGDAGISSASSESMDTVVHDGLENHSPSIRDRSHHHQYDDHTDANGDDDFDDTEYDDNDTHDSADTRM